MRTKVATLALLVACVQAIQYDDHGATSSIVFNNNRNSVHHIQSAYPAQSHGYSAPQSGYSSYEAPVAQYAAPAIKHAGLSNGANSYSSVSFGNDGHGGPSQYAAPAHYTTTSHNAAPAHYTSTSHNAAPAHYTTTSHDAAPAQYPGLAHYSTPSHNAAPIRYTAPSHYISKISAPVNAAPSYYHGGYESHNHQEENTHPKYEFSYGIEDHHTGDIHSHKEARDGDVTHGEYSLHESDGTVRTVKYSVDKHSGFNAIVERSGHATHAQPAKALAAAPILKAIAPTPYYHH